MWLTPLVFFDAVEFRIYCRAGEMIGHVFLVFSRFSFLRLFLARVRTAVRRLGEICRMWVILALEWTFLEPEKDFEAETWYMSRTRGVIGDFDNTHLFCGVTDAWSRQK